MIAGKEELLNKLNELPNYFDDEDERVVIFWATSYAQDCLKLKIPPVTWIKLLDDEAPFDSVKRATLLNHITKSCWPTNYPAMDFASVHSAIKTSRFKDLGTCDQMEFTGLYLISIYTLIYNLQKND